ncbi:MAG: DUF2489 domain-containing protein [Bacteriovoracaceae bacterium]
METATLILFGCLALIVLGLSLYLGLLYGKLLGQKKLSRERQGARERNEKERKNNIKESLNTLALVVMQEQVEPAEGCIRIKKLVDEIEFLKDREELQVFHEMYEEIKEFAVLDDYKELNKQEKFDQDKKRYAIEDRYNIRLKEASKNLREILANPRFH